MNTSLGRGTTDLPKLRSLVLNAVDYSLSKLGTIRDDLLASIQADPKLINAPENASRMSLLSEVYQV